jgi:hypothetical protein
MRIGREGIAGTIGIFLLAGMASISEQRVLAQGAATAPPQRVAVTTTQVKPDMVATWRDLIQKEAVPAFKKAGIPWRWVFSSGPLGGQAFTFTTVTPVANFAQYDQPPAIQRVLGPEGAAKYNAKLLPTVVSTHTVIQTLIPQASLQSYSSTPPALARVATTQLLPGKGPEFTEITASEFLPAFKKAGVADYLVFATTYGGTANERTIVTFHSKYADLDGPNPVAKAMGQEAFQKLNQKRAALTSGTQAIVLRYVPELSYGVPAKPAGSTQ